MNPEHKKVIERLQLIQADANEFWIKLHNYHWNVKGIHFEQIHEFTEQIYNDIAILFDDVAERILQLNAKPFVTSQELLKHKRLESENKNDFDSLYVLNNILKDYEFFLKEFKALSNEAEEISDKATISLADEMIGKLEKNIWLVKSHIKD